MANHRLIIGALDCSEMVMRLTHFAGGEYGCFVYLTESPELTQILTTLSYMITTDFDWNGVAVFIENEAFWAEELIRYGDIFFFYPIEGAVRLEIRMTRKLL